MEARPASSGTSPRKRITAPRFPCLAAILLARKLARDEISVRGAFPGMGFLALAEFEKEFAHWRIATVLKES